MKVLVTGAAGFVGGRLVPRLVDEGHDVYALVRDASRLRAADATVLEVDLARVASSELPAVDAIVHLAQANVPFPAGAAELYAVNTLSTQLLLEHARRTGGKRFVYASSASVYGLGDAPFREEQAPRARDFYAVTKLNGEQLVAAYEGLLDTAALRFVAPYGPGQRGRLVPALFARVREGRAVTLNEGGRPRMNPIYVDDVVRLIVQALSLSGAHTVNVAGDEPVTIRELAESIGRAAGREPVFEAGEAAVAGDVIADTTRMHELFALRPLVPLVEGLERVAAAEREPAQA